MALVHRGLGPFGAHLAHVVAAAAGAAARGGTWAAAPARAAVVRPAPAIWAAARGLRTTAVPLLWAAAAPAARPFATAGRHAAPPPPPEHKTESDAAAEEASDVRTRAERAAGVRAALGAWRATDPLRVRWAIARLLLRTPLDPDVAGLAAQAAALGVYGVAGLVAAGTLGLDTSPLIALGGTAGVAIGLSLRDLLSNAIAGVLLLAQRPFARGDTVTIFVGSSLKIEGVVDALDARVVHLRTEEFVPAGVGPDGAPRPARVVVRRTMIPSGTVFASPIVVIRDRDAGAPPQPPPQR